MVIARDFDWTATHYVRAGIIPYITINNVKFYAFGLGNMVADLCDFGGHREDVDGDLLDTAIREYSEESLNIFGELTRDTLDYCEVLDGDDTAEVLYPLPGDIPMYSYTLDFKQLIGDDLNHEIQNIIWMSKNQIITAVSHPNTTYNGTKIYHMYNKIRSVLINNLHKL